MVPSLLCASPTILDQSFPRDSFELRQVARALGLIQDLLEKDEIHVVLPRILGLFLMEVKWEQRQEQFSELSLITTLLAQWFLQPNDRQILVETSSISTFSPHPLPKDTSSGGWTELWAEEMAKLLLMHDETCPDRFFIGIACERAFTGDAPREWDCEPAKRCFPLVGGGQLQQLENAYVWEAAPLDVGRRAVTFEMAIKNVTVLGAVRVDPPNGGSHYKAVFPRARPWMIDKNIDPVPDCFIRELIDITGYPIDVVRTALLDGRLLRRILRLRTI